LHLISIHFLCVYINGIAAKQLKYFTEKYFFSQDVLFASGASPAPFSENFYFIAALLFLVKYIDNLLSE